MGIGDVGSSHIVRTIRKVKYEKRVRNKKKSWMMQNKGNVQIAIGVGLDSIILTASIPIIRLLMRVDGRGTWH